MINWILVVQCDFYNFALDLYSSKKGDHNEASLRTCISRLYYSIYHSVFDWLYSYKADLLNQFNCGSHEKLQFCLKAIARETKNLKFNQLALKLHSLHSKRCLADYKLKEKHNETHVDLMLKEINSTQALFEELTVSLSKSA